MTVHRRCRRRAARYGPAMIRRPLLPVIAAVSTAVVLVVGLTVADSGGGAASAAVRLRPGAAPTTSVVLPPLPSNTGPGATYAGPMVPSGGVDPSTTGPAAPPTTGPAAPPTSTVPPVMPSTTTTSEGIAFVRGLTDDTGLLSIVVPSSWEAYDTSLFDGNPAISAAADWDRWETFEAAGVLFFAYPYVADVEAVLAANDLVGLCQPGETVPYANRGLDGIRVTFRGCGDAGATNHVWLVSPPDDAYTLYVNLQVVSTADESIVALVESSFGTNPGVALPPGATPAPTAADTTTPQPGPTMTTVTPIVPTVAPAPDPGGVVPPSAPPTTTAAPAGEAPAATTPTTAGAPEAGPPAGYQTVVDSTGTVRLAVPVSWSDVDGASAVLDSGESTFALSAAPDLATFRAELDAAGVYVRGEPLVADPARLLARYGLIYDARCIPDGAQPLVHPQLSGVVGRWRACGGGDVDVVVVVGNPVDPAVAPGRTVTMYVQVPSAEEYSLEVLLGSLDVGGAG